MPAIEKYFNAERAESLLFIIVGLLAISVSMYFLFKIKLPFYNGMSYPFIVVALIQLTVGTAVYLRSPEDIKRVSGILQNDQSRIHSEEIHRMQTVMKNFIIYRWIEIALIVIGIVLFFAFHQGTFMRGVGFGIIIQGSLMLLLDYFAERRGVNYLDFLKEVIK
jgi:hypothetical protein